MVKLKVTQVRSTIGSKKNQIATMEALGLRKNKDEKIHDDSPAIRGMINTVRHLVSVKEIDA